MDPPSASPSVSSTERGMQASTSDSLVATTAPQEVHSSPTEIQEGTHDALLQSTPARSLVRSDTVTDCGASSTREAAAHLERSLAASKWASPASHDSLISTSISSVSGPPKQTSRDRYFDRFDSASDRESPFHLGTLISTESPRQSLPMLPSSSPLSTYSTREASISQEDKQTGANIWSSPLVKRRPPFDASWDIQWSPSRESKLLDQGHARLGSDDLNESGFSSLRSIRSGSQDSSAFTSPNTSVRSSIAQSDMLKGLADCLPHSSSFLPVTPPLKASAIQRRQDQLAYHKSQEDQLQLEALPESVKALTQAFNPFLSSPEPKTVDPPAPSDDTSQVRSDDATSDSSNGSSVYTNAGELFSPTIRSPSQVRRREASKRDQAQDNIDDAHASAPDCGPSNLGDKVIDFSHLSRGSSHAALPSSHVKEASYDQIQASAYQSVSRYLLVENVPPETSQAAIGKTFAPYGTLRGIYLRSLLTQSAIVLAFHDTRDAIAAHAQLPNEAAFGTTLVPHYIKPHEFARVASELPVLSPNEGQIEVRVNRADCLPINSQSMKDLFTSFGDIKSFKQTGIEHVYSCDYWDDRDAVSAIETLHGRVLRGTAFSIRARNEDEVFATAQLPTLPVSGVSYSHVAQSTPLRAPSMRTSCSSLLPTHTQSLDLARSPSVDQFHSSPSYASELHGLNRTRGSFIRKLSAPTMSRSSQMQDSPAGLRGITPQWGLYRDDRVPDNTAFDLQRVRMGLDNRTTVMIRNIPNKLTDLGLLDVLNESSPRSFDFMYLRVDFQSGANTGYAFVNFCTVTSLLTFANTKLGTRWNRCNSDKVIQMSYANVQGKEALINKFRCSSVMDEHVSFRPKIFYSSGPYQGLPEPWP
ncbi:hypothetical protein E5Q_04650 [Mixia osmundae IAM 14324]|uniref:Mei2-like C-terminal RNA recognition motif domain-containing protein n=1 Tax=Mixia osmundae (strain CBS 9802 / IAM 14324 / JCM 22182 / KY 12970) TaxID=764103 RepID=G7E560_MIXOS|nr:hypothetical protein E5Q_04650 [Mixia osmundae IAM 14324]